MFRLGVEKSLQQQLPYRYQINQQFLRYRPTVQFILAELKRRDLPPELALLPMIESSYNPDVISPAKAVGLWQLIPSTAKRFGLEINNFNDQRFDVEKSSQAALDYLSFLYNKFDQDLYFTIAAYNSGEGRVSRAIKKMINHQMANPMSHKEITLPGETQSYIYKFFALQQLVDEAVLRLDVDYIWLNNKSKSGVMIEQIETDSSKPNLLINDEVDKHQKALSKKEQVELINLYNPQAIINMNSVKPLIDLN
ncbi:lytic transglycosylase domain-containing protein [Vibrio sp. SS-MA-C1-2]|uniref:lytic transglycosylase domain-containing protein n=1 Tax=Vibrio sp. SS-MA-C1-2 TaxID=2908646 RepID=UPI001F3EF48B|nr:lytic transglycosylase domain-containing protein [Vibrio sp. SS-MA-C1-2]UJF18010.1 lytic transglycosylase domain-containing protein [Vibrio sp. SS-MA-C1-2]